MGRRRNPNTPEKEPPWPELLRLALPYIEAVAEVQQVSYGGFFGGDPRTFTPDEQVCMPEEIRAWEAACERWAGGDRTPAPIGCLHYSDGRNALFITGRTVGFGLGTNVFHDSDAVTLVQHIRKKLKLNPWQPPERPPNDVDLPEQIDLDTPLPPGPAVDSKRTEGDA